MRCYVHNDQIVGTCSICGGPVSVPTMWWGVIPPTPTCQRCGAQQRQSYGPVIPMERPLLPVKTFELTWTYGGVSDRVTLDDAAAHFPLTFDRVWVRY